MGSAGIDATHEGTRREAWRRGLAIIAALAAAAFLIGLVVLVASSNRERDAAMVRERHSYEVVIVSRALDAALARSEAALGRFVVSSDKQTGALYFDEWRKAGRLLDRLRVLTRDNPEQVELGNELARLYIARGRELAAPASQSNYGRAWEAVGLFYQAGQAASLTRINAILTQISDQERAILHERSLRAAESTERSNRLAALLSGLGLLLVVAALGLGWATVSAFAEQRLARRDAQAEAERAETLEYAVAERTRELREANESLRREGVERAAAEAQLRQVQKMEAVGQLTGGIAHDFNNMLAVVVGGLDLARRRLSHEAQEVGRHIDNAMEGANRAAALTKRLLAFARAEPLLPEGLDPAKLISGMSDLLDRALGERISMTLRAADDSWQIWCDPSQFENAVLNLAVNARDAMEGEGELTIETSNVTLAAGEVNEAPAGDYVRIDVTDTGVGMTPEVRDRAFEPFFTTKPVGKGTGLGLSQIFGFIRQSEGDIAIRSAPGEGTTVSLYLPRFTAKGAAQDATIVEEAVPPVAIDASGTTILVVEDDPRVRNATVGALAEIGYVPLPCPGGEEALALLAQHPEIGLVISDVVMPGMTGPELADEIARQHPDLGILFVTGFVGEAGDAGRMSGRDVLRKPFTVSALEAAVAAALHRHPPAHRAA
ncbi:His Kinase A (phospho-acceptor) domain-containing protein [Sphingomonas laterariae]|uniref:histidine kinase n=1 Tax=Edaphosphingomonas laterariae TaxID=861865 RepID=A0A239H1J9_9SPHN|nr:ATP-binding protein [Sphingomonas laterariae]SNS74928.1 His Kinase A (phospho-acceptor) domain-containing protein [Sphingomonas laterariae]